MSGAGKTTIGRQVHAQWKKEAANTVLVDGDDVRAIFAQDRNPNTYTVAGRRRNAERVMELCAWLDRQNINVVCCILCIFEDILTNNREKFSNYFEVFVTAPMETLEKRDVKNLYGPAIRGERQNVVGVDIPFPTPKQPNMVVDNSREGVDPRLVANNIIDSMNNRLSEIACDYPYAKGDRLEERNSYFYTPFEGKNFIRAWEQNRAPLLALEPPTAPTPADISGNTWEHDAKKLLEHLMATVTKDQSLLDKLLQRFEVTKRIYTTYNSNLRPMKPEEYHDLELYLRWAEVLETAYSHTEKLPYLNALLKVLDTLISQDEKLTTATLSRLAWLLEREKKHVKTLAASLEVTL